MIPAFKALAIVQPPGALSLQWTAPVTLTNPVAYRIYQGGFSQTYTSVVDVPFPNLTTTITGLNQDRRYFFNITSVYPQGESVPGGEIIVWQVSTNEPALQPPDSFTYSGTSQIMFQQSSDLITWSTFIAWFPATNHQFYRTLYKTQ